MFQTTRRRLAIWYTTTTAVLLFLFASGFFWYVRTTLIERVDDTLDHVVEVLQRSLVIETRTVAGGGSLQVNVAASFRDNPVAVEDDHIDLEWFSPQGERIWHTLPESIAVPLQAKQTAQTVEIARAEPLEPLILRQVTRPLSQGSQLLGYLRVSEPWFEVTKPSRRLLRDLLVGTTATISAVGFVGWFLSRLAMEPVFEAYQRLKQFTADASHELRSPLAIIQTNVQVALSDPNPDLQQQQQYLKVVERLTRRLGRLVDDLLFLARQDSGLVQAPLEGLDLDWLVAEVVEEQQTLAQDKGVALTYQAHLPEAEDNSSGFGMQGDRDQLARLFTNLITNAVQYTPSGGEVSVQLRRHARSGLQVEICDTGIGIAPEALPKIFDRFYRADTARTQTETAGSGLGLAIAQAIATRHQGQIELHSQMHQGTQVTVGFPQRPESVASGLRTPVKSVPIQ
jgi:two-component system, OmpR family, manganese sensing sensor histidine kinase